MQPTKAEPKVKGDLVSQSCRVLNTIDNQVRSLRKRVLLSSLVSKEQFEIFWSIRGNINNYPASGKLDCPFDRTQQLANIATDLAGKDKGTKRRMINWGYAICDAGIRGWVENDLPPPEDFPFPAEKV